MAGIAIGSFWVEQRPTGIGSRFGKFSLQEVYALNGKKTWPALDALNQLPDELVIATTEVGLPGAWNPDKKIIDMAGLNDPANAGNFFDAEVFFDDHQPDLIYFPHPHYAEMQKAILAHSVFKKKYEYFPSDKTGTFLGIAILKKSKWHNSIKSAVMIDLVDER